MKEKNINVLSIHGADSQDERDLVIREFRNESSKALFTTEYLANGIDIQKFWMK